jgi:hypothetical protein
MSREIVEERRKAEEFYTGPQSKQPQSRFDWVCTIRALRSGCDLLSTLLHLRISFRRFFYCADLKILKFSWSNFSVDSQKSRSSAC